MKPELCFPQVAAGKMLENEVPVFVVTFTKQGVLRFKNAKTGEVVFGAGDRVEQCHYAAVITSVEDEIENELTAGWKIVEMARRSARAYLQNIPTRRWFVFASPLGPAGILNK